MILQYERLAASTHQAELKIKKAKDQIRTENMNQVRSSKDYDTSDPEVKELNQQLKQGYKELRTKKQRLETLKKQLYGDENEEQQDTGRKKKRAPSIDLYGQEKEPIYVRIKRVQDDLTFHDKEIARLKEETATIVKANTVSK